MASSFESRVVAGLNHYRLVASMHVRHPSVSPDEVSSSLGLEPKRVRRRGQQKCSPAGKLLNGTYTENYWTADLEILAGHDTSDFLNDLMDRRIGHAIDFTRRLDDTGGATSILVGLYADGGCDFEIPAATLRRLGDAGITVRFDFYGAETGELPPEIVALG